MLKPQRNGLLFLLSLVLTAIWLRCIWPNNFSWLGYCNVTQDLSQHLSGWYAFVADQWRFPLLKTILLDYPMGTTVSLTDSIPLFALTFKLFRAVLPPDFNYFSVFFIVCYLAQAFAAMSLACSLNQRSILGVTTFVLFALSAPIVSHQIANEDSLGCQCFILFALSLYFANHQQHVTLLKLQVYFGLLIALSLLVHPYLTAMIYPFYLACLYEYRKQPAVQSIWMSTVYLHGLIALEFMFFGLGQGVGIVAGFGYYTMNLVAPIYGGALHHDQSLIAGPGQKEGFAYMGLGLILMIPIALYCIRRSFLRLIRAYGSLLILALCFFIYAIYGLISWGHLIIAHYQTPLFFITYSFRMNGRFFWPCMYILMSFAIATLLKKNPKRACFVLPILLALQLFDTAGYTHDVRLNLQTAMQPFPESKQQIMAIMRQSKIVIYQPVMNCLSLTPDADHLLIQTQYLAAYSHIPMNTAYTAHYIQEINCPDDSLRFKTIHPQLLVSDTEVPSAPIQKLLKKQSHDCKIIENGYYCLVF